MSGYISIPNNAAHKIDMEVDVHKECGEGGTGRNWGIGVLDVQLAGG